MGQSSVNEVADKRRLLDIHSCPREEERLAYSIPELARKLGVSPAFLRLEAARQKLILTRLGRRALVRAEEVERYLRAGEAR